ncbi:HET-domain-containing protein [Cadophora sp. DSE1049]|nr:HET-domain-containing protein [Cadophora sp. DSE1049]
MALSYCWGWQGQVVTTVSNIQSHMRGIAVSSLPKTIQDAVHVARGLEIPNLWIDSLCIIQDDPTDKAVEIAQMPLVYSQATLTLKASRSSDVHEGFLGERQAAVADAVKGRQFQLPYRCLSGTTEMVDIFLHFDEYMTEPLDTRAWALQERFLSSRLPDFGTYQTRWLCQLKGDGIPTDGYRGVLVDDEQTLDHLLWRKLVGIYGSRKLTFQSDRLPAISGLAIRFASLLDDQYYAGLWKSRLAYDLLWHTTFDDFEGTCIHVVELNGPSWSWCSVPGPIIFLDNIEEKGPAVSLDISNIQTDLTDGGGLYGAVLSGSLIVTGQVQEALCYSIGGERHPWHIATLERSIDGTSLHETIPSYVKWILEPRWKMASLKSQCFC